MISLSRRRRWWWDHDQCRCDCGVASCLSACLQCGEGGGGGGVGLASWWIWRYLFHHCRNLIKYVRKCSLQFPNLWVTALQERNNQPDLRMETVDAGVLLFAGMVVKWITELAPVCTFDTEFVSFRHLTCKNLHTHTTNKNKQKHINWHAQFRIWHVVWLVKK